MKMLPFAMLAATAVFIELGSAANIIVLAGCGGGDGWLALQRGICGWALPFFFGGGLISTPVRDRSQNHQLFQPALLLRWVGAGMMLRRRR
jgi:hypothetical protein